MNWLQNNFGGSVAQGRRDKYSIYRWDIRSKAAQQFLTLLKPYVKIKKEQLDIALEFEREKGKYLDTLKGHQGFRQLSDEEISKRLQIKKMLQEKKREYKEYTKPSSGTTTKREDTAR